MERIAALCNRLPMGEIVKFGTVGVLATLTHFLVLTLVVERVGIPPTPANGLAFCVAVLVTYVGQSYWVFQRTDHNLVRLQKFVGTAVGGLFANVGIMWLAVNALQLPYLLGFAAALIIVPAATFAINKFWVFSGSQTRTEAAFMDRGGVAWAPVRTCAWLHRRA